MESRESSAFEAKARSVGFSKYRMREVEGTAIAVWRKGTDGLPNGSDVPAFSAVQFKARDPVRLVLPFINVDNTRGSKTAAMDDQGPSRISDFILSEAPLRILANNVKVADFPGPPSRNATCVTCDRIANRLMVEKKKICKGGSEPVAFFLYLFPSCRPKSEEDEKEDEARSISLTSEIS